MDLMGANIHGKRSVLSLESLGQGRIKSMKGEDVDCIAVLWNELV